MSGSSRGMTGSATHYAGGKPSQGTRKDQRLNTTKGKPRPPKPPKKGKS